MKFEVKNVFRVVFVVCFMLCAFFDQGFYSPANWLWPAVFLFSVTLLYIIYALIRNEELHPCDFILLILVLFYGAALLFGVESVDGTVKEMIKVTMYSCLLFLLLGSKRVKNGVFLLQTGLIIISYTILASTYAVIFKLFSTRNFWLELNHHVSGLGIRLGGFLGYPNAFAIIIVSLMLFHLLQTPGCKNWKVRAVHYFPLTPYAVLLLLTESRGAWIVLVLGWLLGLFLFKVKAQLEYILATLGTAIGTIFVYFGSSGIVSGNLLWLALLVALSALLVWSSQWIALVPVKWHKPFFLPVLVLGVLLLLALDLFFHGLCYRLLPSPLQARLGTGGATFSDRLLYIKDVWRASDHFIWNGAGGGAWKSLMYQTQTSPYISNELHNFFMNTWVEIGIFGLIAVCVLLVVAIRQMLRSRSLMLPSFAAILLHGLIDFSLSFGFIVFLLLYFYALSDMETGAKKNSLRLSKKVFAIMNGWIVLLLFVMVIFTFRFGQAELAFQQRNAAQAVQLNPFNMSYRLEEAAESSPQKAADIIANGLKYEPHQSYALYQLAVLDGEAGRDQQARKLYEEAIRLDPYDAYKYEGYIEYLAKRKQYGEAVRIYRQQQHLTRNSYKTENQRHFRITKKTKKIMENIKNG